jgi:hypothetical protein
MSLFSPFNRMFKRLIERVSSTAVKRWCLAQGRTIEWETALEHLRSRDGKLIRHTRRLSEIYFVSMEAFQHSKSLFNSESGGAGEVDNDTLWCVALDSDPIIVLHHPDRVAEWVSANSFHDSFITVSETAFVD